MRRRLLVGTFAGALALAQVLGTNLAAHAASKTHTQLVRVSHVGSINLRAAASAAKGTSAGMELSPGTADPSKPQPSKHLQHTYSAGQPAVSPTSVSDASKGFDGVNHMQQRYAGAGNSTWQNTQFSTIPSDQGLCVSSGLTPNFVVEPVNDAVRVYGTDGTPTSSYIMPLNQFFNQQPSINRTTHVYGPTSIGDPECYFDTATQRWFATVYELGVDTSTGAFIAPTGFLVNVSRTSDPNGTWDTYLVDGSNPNGDADCTPCFPDHPNLGADANGIYVTTDNFGLNNSFFGGAQLYAFSKSGLESGTSTSAAHIDMKTISDWTLGAPPFLAWPAQSPAASDWDTNNSGTEYIGSAMDVVGGPAIHGVNASSFGVWALTNTSSLGTTPDLTLHFVNTPTELYSQPPNAIQKNGPYPLGQGDYNGLLGLKVQGAEELVESDEDETSQSYYSNGTLWNAVNTSVKEPNGATVAGLAWMAFNPTADGSSVSAPLAQQGYLAAPKGNDLQYPSIASTADGSKTVMVFDLVGPDYYPSIAETTLSTSSSGNSGINVVRWGNAPLDTFGGYQVYKYQPGMSRQGDYTAAVADTSGNIWIAAQWVEGNALCVDPSLATCGTDNRSALANWATWIAKT